MTSKRYKKISAWFRQRPAAYSLLRGMTQYLTVFFYVSYFILSLYTIVTDRKRALKVVGVPAATYIAGSLVRALINAPRPYEVLDIDPLVPKDTKGKSFPSRHVFSAFVIAAAFLFVSLPLGILFLIIAVIVAATRVLSGVHFIKDVIAGMIFGLGSGILGFFCIRDEEEF